MCLGSDHQHSSKHLAGFHRSKAALRGIGWYYQEILLIVRAVITCGSSEFIRQGPLEWLKQLGIFSIMS